MDFFDLMQYICAGGLVAGFGAVFWKARKENIESRKKAQRYERLRNELDKILDCGEYSEDESLVARLVQADVFSYRHPEKIYEKIAKKLDVDYDKMKELVKEHDPYKKI